MRLSLLALYLAVLFLLQKGVNNTCLSYEHGSTYPTDNSSYCRNFIFNLVGILQWDVSDTTLSTFPARDA
jgi:hypothetical protein